MSYKIKKTYEMHSSVALHTKTYKIHSCTRDIAIKFSLSLLSPPVKSIVLNISAKEPTNLKKSLLQCIGKIRGRKGQVYIFVEKGSEKD